jgi:hypothetical protein
MTTGTRCLRRRIHGIAAIATAIGALGGCSGAEDASAPDGDVFATDINTPRTGELLLANPPAGWVETGAMRTDVLSMAEYGPATDVDGEIERLTFEAQSGSPLPDPIRFVLGVNADLKRRCNGFQGVNVASGVENGYPTSVRLMICPRFKDSDHGQVVLAKAIQGEEKFYVITRRRLAAPFVDGAQPLDAQAMAEWTTLLKRIRLCDTRTEAHACPAEVTAAAAPPAP